MYAGFMIHCSKVFTDVDVNMTVLLKAQFMLIRISGSLFNLFSSVFGLRIRVI